MIQTLIHEYTKPSNFLDISEAVGQVPTVRIKRTHKLLDLHTGLMKLESCNPTGSIKDKNASYLISQAEAQGLLKPGGTIIESSSGNFGIALAALGASRGYKVIIVVDSKTSKTMKNMLLAYGAFLEEVPLSLADENGSMQKARMDHAKKLSTKIPDAYYPCQHLNPDNPSAHFLYTGREIVQQTKGQLDAVVVGISTAGQITGLSRYLKIHSPQTKVIAVDVSGSKALGTPGHSYKMTGLGLSFTPPNLDLQLIDLAYSVSDQLAFSLCQAMAQKEGLLLGASTGAILAGALSYMNQASSSQTVLMINPDRGDRYLETIYSPKWLTDNGISILAEEEIDLCIRRLKPLPFNKKLEDYHG